MEKSNSFGDDIRVKFEKEFGKNIDYTLVTKFIREINYLGLAIDTGKDKEKIVSRFKDLNSMRPIIGKPFTSSTYDERFTKFESKLKRKGWL